MSYQANVCTIMVSAPSDCSEELQRAREVIYKWNAVNSRARRMVLLPVDWKNNTMPRAGAIAQENINEQITFHADALIAIFKNRLGTPTEKHPSGTIEEIHEVVNAGKRVLLYFSDEQVDRALIDSDQVKSIQMYRASCSTSNHYATYCDMQDFSSKIDLHLGMLANEIYEKIDSIIQVNQTFSLGNTITDSKIHTLTEAANEILIAAALDDGVIMLIQYIGGETIQAGLLCVEFKNSDARRRTMYEEAIEELENLGMIRSEGYERKMFKVTSAGYAYADKSNA